MTTLFGWDLLYKIVEGDIENDHDILICLTHLVLVSNDFKCIGLGESKVLDGDEPKSEALPKNWNERYALRIDEGTVSFVQLNPLMVVQRSGMLYEMIPNNQNIVEQIKVQLIDKVILSKKSKETSVQTDPQRKANVPDDPSMVPNASGQKDFVPFPNLLPADYGRSDLGPLGGMGPLRLPGPVGGGMLFQPPGPSFGGAFGDIPAGLPPGALPPGARFDPFRPPDTDRFSPRRPPHRPDSDELLLLLR